MLGDKKELREERKGLENIHVCSLYAFHVIELFHMQKQILYVLSECLGNHETVF